MYVDAAALAHALGLAGACRVHDPQQRLARSVASQAVTCSRCTAEGSERKLLGWRCQGRNRGVGSALEPLTTTAICEVGR